MSGSPDWHLYLIRCPDGSLYTGITTDPPRRLEEHRAGRGAKRLRGLAPLDMIYTAPVGDRGAALRLEYRVKRLSRRAKLELVAGRLQLGDLGAPRSG